ncbi:hypothetical protein KC19_7G082000 [Ceratodon purpureus]|uniref:Uncharacterized protein n=1 Tax=Ceratodon purpureus TaxID=3225 RepID=A0A8T0H8W6_CERPU|nr:hypothetical protein KC19_7G082000 [Ceratodon purpureus]
MYWCYSCKCFLDFRTLLRVKGKTRQASPMQQWDIEGRASGCDFVGNFSTFLFLACLQGLSLVMFVRLLLTLSGCHMCWTQLDTELPLSSAASSNFCCSGTVELLRLLAESIFGMCLNARD